VDGFVSSNRYPGNGEDLSVEVSVNDGKIGELPVSRMNGMNGTNKYRFKGITKIKNIKLWYPLGVGEQCLYDFSFVLKYKGNGVYFDEKRIGFRRIEIIQEKDAEGEIFIFRVNLK
jgi:Beta-galactosidase/beta-glucuronidase